MNFVLTVLGVLGLYFLLGMWTALKATVCFSALGMSFTWFAVLFVIGCCIIGKVTLSK